MATWYVSILLSLMPYARPANTKYYSRYKFKCAKSSRLRYREAADGEQAFLIFFIILLIMNLPFLSSCLIKFACGISLIKINLFKGNIILI